MPIRYIAWAALTGILVGGVAAVSSLTLVVIASAILVIALVRRDLAAEEADLVTVLLVAGLAARALAIVALNIASARTHTDQTAGLLFGDEAYTLARSLRTRDVLLGLPVTKLDYQVMFDSYSRTAYMSFLTAIQVLFGSSPYAVRLMNSVLFVAGAGLLYRVARSAFGVVPALAGLTTLLFLPSLFLFSLSILKESAYFLLGAALLASTVWIVRSGSWGGRLASAVLFALCLWAVADLRPGAIVLTGGAMIAGAAACWLLATRWRAGIAAAAVVVSCAAIAVIPSLSNRVLSALTMTAKQHTGHAFTVGHAYKTLDESLYEQVSTPAASLLSLTAPQAARYVARSAYAFVTLPFPWQVATRSEAAFVPEQLLWYGLCLFAVAGIVPAWRRDPLVTSLLVAAILPTAAVVALTSGNVGTLVRLRGLVTPLLVWISAVGLVVTVNWLVTRTAGEISRVGDAPATT